MKKTLGLIIPIILLAGALLFVLYKFNKTNKENKTNINQLTTAKKQLEGELEQLSVSYDSLHTENNNLQKDIDVEKAKVKNLIAKLKRTKQNSVAQINKYYTQVSNLKDQMQTYIAQIDSLKNINQQLSEENSIMRNQVKKAGDQIEALQAQQNNLNEKLKGAQKLEAMSITVQALKQNGKKSKKAKKTQRVKVSFILSKNDVMERGNLDLYVIIKKPNGQVISSKSGGTFSSSAGTQKYTIRRQVLYNKEYLPVAMFYDKGTTFISGKYDVEIFANDTSIGKAFFSLK